MKYAIIAAGEGSRLASEGVDTPKPLVRINGEPIVDRLIRIFIDNEAEEIVVICNDRTSLVSRHLEQIRQQGLNGRHVPLRLVVKSTPSSMHSMYEISAFLEGSPFCLTTVDTIFKEEEFSDYINSLTATLRTDKGDGLMAVTDYIDDEKPLYISVDNDMKITGFHDEQNGCQLVSGGIYGLTPRAINTLRQCVGRGESRMRNFQRALIADGMNLTAYKFSKILDIDHKEDIMKAERFLKKTCLAVYRAERYSPNAVDRDAAIMDAVCKELLPYYNVLRCKEDELGARSIQRREAQAVVSMARSGNALQLLKEKEQDTNITVVNSPASLLNMSRSKTDSIMRHNNIPCAPLYGKAGWWIKRGDAAAQDNKDVRFAAANEKNKIVDEFNKRGITDLVVTAHLKGDLVKFYGVRGTGFFSTYYPTDGTYTKFGDERHNGAARHTPFDKGGLQADAERLSELTGIDVYGGDCIVDEKGTWAIIDFNDWPSFASCREEAAKAIARLIIKRDKRRQ